MNDDKKTKFLSEPLSNEFKESVYNAVEKELQLNKQSSKSNIWKSFGFPALATSAFALVVYFQIFSGVNNTELNLETNLIMELSALSPDEVEMVKDLDFMEALDKLTPEELEEITL